MPRKKVETETTNEQAAAPQERATRAKSALLNAYKQARAKIDPVLLKESRQFGAHNIVFTPAYEPPELSMAWVDVPSGDPVRDERFYRLLNEEGYVIMHPEHVADTYEEAVQEGKYYFRVKLDVITVNGVDAVGFAGRDIIAVWRPREIAEQMRERSIERFKQLLSAERRKNLEVSVTEGRSTLGDIVASQPEKKGG